MSGGSRENACLPHFRGDLTAPQAPLRSPPPPLPHHLNRLLGRAGTIKQNAMMAV